MRHLGTDHPAHVRDSLGEECQLFLMLQVVATAGDNIPGSLGFFNSHLCTAAMGKEELTGSEELVHFECE